MSKINPKWNPKRLGKAQSSNCPGLETEVWCYLTGGKLEMCIQVSKDGIVLGQTRYDLRLPKPTGGVSAS